MRWSIAAAAAALLVTSAAARAGDAAPTKPMTWPVDVVVTDEDGHAVLGARVEAFADPAVPPRTDGREVPPAEFLDPARKSRVPDAAATTDASGAAHVDGLTFGRSVLVVTRPGFAPRRRTVTNPGAESPVRVELLRGHPLDGRVLSDDGRPVAGALVVAAYHGRSHLSAWVAEELSPFDPWTRTGPAGRWHFDALPEGDVAIAAAPAGTWSSRLDVVRIPGVTSYDFVLEPQSPVSGTVRDKATGDPVAGAIVDVHASAWHEDHGRAVCDSHGRWSIPMFRTHAWTTVLGAAPGYRTAKSDVGPEGGDVFVERAAPETPNAPPATGPGWIRGIVLDEFGAPERHVEIRRQGPYEFNATSGDGTFVLACDDTANPVRVWAIHAKDDFVSDVATPAASAEEAVPVVLRWPRAPTFRLKGVIRRPEGVPLVHPRVIAHAAAGAEAREPWSPASPDGRFELEILESQSVKFDVGATADGCTIATADTPQSGVEILLSVGASLRGRALLGDAPIAGAIVRLAEDLGSFATSGHDEPQLAPAFATSSEDGSFAMSTLPNGRFVVIVSAPGTLATRAPVELVNGKTATVDVALLRPKTIRGVVKWPDGAPVAGADVWARGTTRDSEQWQDGDASETATDAQGAFVLRGLRPGRFDVVAGPKRDGSDVRQNFLETRQSGVEAGESAASIVVRAGAILTGRVVDERGAPVVGARVYVEAQGHAGGSDLDRTGVAASDGSFELPALGDGPYVLTARAEKLRSVRMSDVRAGGAALHLVLLDGMTLDGVVVDGAGAPQAGREVTASRADDTWPHPTETARARTDESGRFHLGGLDDGRVRLQVPDGEDRGRPEDFVTTYANPGERNARIVVPSDHELVGAVSEFVGETVGLRRLPGAAIRVDVEGRTDPVLAVTGEDGAFRIGGLPWAPCTVHATLEGYEEVAAPTVWPNVMAEDVILRRKPAK